MKGEAVGEGVVYICGAGPGDAKLMTVRAMELLKTCDVVLYDRLVSNEVINEISVTSEKIYVGKKVGDLSKDQAKINSLMARHARLGKRVLRLKGGDPFTFGRGAEEAEYLFSKKVKFEIIPGISSAIACPAYAGIPLTHRKYSSSIVIATGHEDPTKSNVRIDWKSIGRADTIVILMGLDNLEHISKTLVKTGLNKKTNVAIIENGTTKQQRCLHANLENVVLKVKEANVKPPAVIVIGRVAALHHRLSWFRK